MPRRGKYEAMASARGCAVVRAFRIRGWLHLLLRTAGGRLLLVFFPPGAEPARRLARILRGLGEGRAGGERG